MENWCDHRAKHQQQVQLDFHLTASCSICVCEMLHSSIHPRRIRNDTTSPQTKKEVSMEFPFLKLCIDILPSATTTYISEKGLFGFVLICDFSLYLEAENIKRTCFLPYLVEKIFMVAWFSHHRSNCLQGFTFKKVCLLLFRKGINKGNMHYVQ